MTNIYGAIEAERQLQRDHRGDSHDDWHSSAEWALLALRFAGKLAEALERCQLSADPQINAGMREYGFDSRLLTIQDAAIKLAAVSVAVAERVSRRLLQEDPVSYPDLTQPPPKQFGIVFDDEDLPLLRDATDALLQSLGGSVALLGAGSLRESVTLGHHAGAIHARYQRASALRRKVAQIDEQMKSGKDGAK